MPFFTGKTDMPEARAPLDATGGFLLGKKLSKTFLSTYVEETIETI